MFAVLVHCLLLSAAVAQQAGTLKVEEHPCVGVQKCTKAGGCTTEPASVTMDAQWRWVHAVGPAGTQNCFDSGRWDPTLCSDGKKCAANCAVEALTSSDYANTYGVTPTPGGVQLKYVNGQSVGSRLYVMDTDNSNYKLWKLKNREFSFKVDVSTLTCGMNGAVYFVEMDAAGGKGVGNNMAGAPYGTGYCDAQCPHDLKFIDGEANVKDWDMTKIGPPIGHYGSCCTEMDIWEANSLSTAWTTHTCETNGPKRCEGLMCGDNHERYHGVCDKDGCDYNSYRMGATNFFGPGLTVDTMKPIYVVTQFLTSDGTDAGDLSEIRRLYMQDGRIIPNSEVNISGFSEIRGDSITDEVCAKSKQAFDNRDDFTKKGGLKKMGEVLDRGLVLVLSLWDDPLTKMEWLDSATMEEGPTTQPGVLRGPCPTQDGNPSQLRSMHGDESVKYTDFRYGEIGSTFALGSTTEPVLCSAPPPEQPVMTHQSVMPVHQPWAPVQSSVLAPAPVSAPSSTCLAAYSQCGGKTWTGSTCCQTGCSCTSNGEYYSLCVPANPAQSQGQCSAPTTIADGIAAVLMTKNSERREAVNAGDSTRHWARAAARRWTAPRSYARLLTPPAETESVEAA